MAHKTAPRTIASMTRDTDGTDRRARMREDLTDGWLSELEQHLEDAAIAATFTMSPSHYRGKR